MNPKLVLTIVAGCYLAASTIDARSDWFNPDAVIIQNFADETISCKFVEDVNLFDTGGTETLYIKIRCRMARQVAGDCTASKQCAKIELVDDIGQSK